MLFHLFKLVYLFCCVFNVLFGILAELNETRRKRTARKLKELGLNSTPLKKTAQAGPAVESTPSSKTKPILMVEVENIQHEKFKTTEEVKVNE